MSKEWRNYIKLPWYLGLIQLLVSYYWRFIKKRNPDRCINTDCTSCYLPFAKYLEIFVQRDSCFIIMLNQLNTYMYVYKLNCKDNSVTLSSTIIVLFWFHRFLLSYQYVQLSHIDHNWNLRSKQGKPSCIEQFLFGLSTLHGLLSHIKSGQCFL